MAKVLLSKSDPFLKRLGAYLGERFPLLNGFMFFVLYSTTYAISSYYTSPAGSLRLDSRFFSGFVAVYCFFFHLRVFDEHKDFEKDCIYHPQRVLQSGLITLKNLRL